MRLLFRMPVYKLTHLRLLRGIRSGNVQAARDIAAWTFQESNVLRIDKIEHHRVNETESREVYTNNDQLVSSFCSRVIIITSQSYLLEFRSTAHISPSSTQLRTHGSHTPVSTIFNFRSPCSIPTFARRFLLSLVNQVNTRLRSEPLTDTEYSNLLSTTSAKGSLFISCYC